MHFKLLEKKYHQEIKENCGEFKQALDECMLNNFNKDEFCNFEITKFNSCIERFNTSWIKKYKNYTFNFD